MKPLPPRQDARLQVEKEVHRVVARDQVPSYTSCYPSLPHEHPGASCFMSIDGERVNVEAATFMVHLPDTPGYWLQSTLPTPARPSKEATHRSVGQQWLLHHWQVMKCVCIH